jgi:hypothetical protein
MATSPPVVRAAATGAARLLTVRWLVRPPVWAYRARLGVLFGSRLVMLEHTGRTSGRRRFVVLEVAGAWATLKPALERTLGGEAGDLPMVALDLAPAAAAQPCRGQAA